MPISFNTIPAAWREPGWLAEMDNTAANSGAAGLRKILILGQKLPAGTLAKEVTSPVITSDSQAAELFGLGSPLHRMIKAWRYANKTSQIYGMALDDAAGVRATGSITFAGPATADGVLSLYIGGQKVSVNVSNEDTAAEIAAACRDAINTYSAAITSGNLTVGHWYKINGQSLLNFTTDGAADSLVGTVFQATSATLTLTAADNVKEITSIYPVIAHVVEIASPTVLRFVAKNKGTLGNIDIRLNYLGALGGEATPAGVTATISAMASGATDPTLTAAIAAMEAVQYFAIVQPYTDTTNLNAIAAKVAADWEPMIQLYGHSWAGKSDTVANLTTAGNARNDPGVTIFGVYKSPTPIEEIIAACSSVAIAALEIDPARPLHSLAVDWVLAPVVDYRFSKTENNTLLYDGISPINWTATDGCALGRVITNYQTNTSGEADDSYLDVTTRYTLQLVIEYLKTWVLSKYPRVKLVADGTPIPAGQAAVTPLIIKGELVAAYKKLQDRVVVQNLAAFIDNMICEINATDPNRLDVEITPVLAGQLDVIAVKNKFYLQFSA